MNTIPHALRRPRSLLTGMVLLALALGGFAQQAVAPPPNAPATVAWDAALGKLALCYHGSVIFDGTLRAEDASGKAVTGTAIKLEQPPATAGKDKIEQRLKFTLAEPKEGVKLVLRAAATGSAETFPAETAGEAQKRFPLVRNSVGVSRNLRNNALYDRHWDWMLEGPADGTTRISPVTDKARERTFGFESKGSHIELTFRPRFYQKHRNLGYIEPWTYQPWKGSITGYCTWWAYKYDFTQKTLDELTDVFSQKKLPDFGYKYVQLDDTYQIGNGSCPQNWLTWNPKFPGGALYAVEKIKSAGMEGGIWEHRVHRPSDPHVADIGKAHPDWFVKKEDGTLFMDGGFYLLNTKNKEAIDGMVRPIYRELKKQGWGYVKIDGAGDLLNAYKNPKCEDHFKKISSTPEQSLRDWDVVAREELGQDIYILSCWGGGPGVNVIGLADGNRLSDDGFQPETLAKFNSYEGVVWRNDPDHCDIFAIREARPYPWVLSTTRHISQGGVCLIDEKWDGGSNSLIGSSAVVAGDPYVLTVHVPAGFRLKAAAAGGEKVEVVKQQETAAVRIVPEATRTVEWKLQFTKEVPAKPACTAAGLPAEGKLDAFLGAPKFDMQQVFKGGRFPNIVVAADGTVLAFWDGVKVRRSEDGGKSWGEEILVGKGFMGGGVTVDENSGDILAFVETKHNPQASLTVYRSTDHGKTWQAQETVIHPNKDGNVPTMHMNEHGITLRHGAHKGRLLRPTRWYAGSNDPSFYPKHYTDAIYSDDGGRTWQTSDPFPANGTGEATLAELSDGGIYYNSRRHWDPKGDLRCRWTASSDDGGETWKDCAACRILPDGDQCRDYGLMGGLVRLPIVDKDILVFSNVESPTGRDHGTVWASFDGGKTWPLKRLVAEGPFAYSSLDAGRPGTPGEGWIFLQFENGDAGATVARFSLSWLLGGVKTGDGEVPQWLGPPPAHEGLGAAEPVAKPQAAVVEMTVQLDEVRHQMAGGVGASWHSISREMTFDEKLLSMDRTSKTARGSGWGGNPPVTDVAKWQRIEELASWLGMDWLRVELQQCSYEPGKDRFDWSNDEMQALYRILDWCERTKADVFLTQMYSNVEWNAYDGVSPVQSAPKNMDDFAVGLATLVEHLVTKKKYTCIKWICITNEPAGDWSWWLGPGRKMLSITPGLQAVRAELDQRGIRIPLSAPDWNHIGDPPANGFDFAPQVGAYDSHDYGHANPIGMGRWVKLAHAENKPFFLSEMGNMWLGWGDSNPGPRSYAHGLSLANTVLSGMNTGVDGFNRWSFTNRGDLDGQWQLVRTWDSASKKYLDLDGIVPEPIPYYAYAMLTRFSAKHSAVLNSTISGENWPEFEATYKRPPASGENWPAFEASYGGVNFAALRSPKGDLTFIVLNKEPVEREIMLRLKGMMEAATLHCYQITESAINQAAFKLDARKTHEVSAATPGFKDTLPPSSITVYSTFRLQHSAAGVTSN